MQTVSVNISKNHYDWMLTLGPLFGPEEVLDKVLTRAREPNPPKVQVTPSIPVKTQPQNGVGWSHSVRANREEQRGPVKSILFPEGVEFKGEKGELAVMTTKGLAYNGKVYQSFSKAAQVASGAKSKNGWKYWLYLDPETQEWRELEPLRAGPSKWGTLW